MNSKVRHNERNLVEDAYGRLDELVVEDLEMQFEAGAVRGVIPGREALVRSGHLDVINYIKQRIRKARSHG